MAVKNIPKNGVKAGWHECVIGGGYITADSRIFVKNCRILSEEDAKEVLAIRNLVPSIKQARELLKFERQWKPFINHAIKKRDLK